MDEGTGKVNGSGVASVVGNAYSNAIDKFKNSFDETLASGNVPTSGPNGEYLKLNHKLVNMQILMVMEL